MSVPAVDIGAPREARTGTWREFRARMTAMALLVRFVVAPPADDGRDDE